ncbi:hemerythrin domain-containing protein [Miniphocaeibacter halophilus]|uniref:Hemerythrin domain-containing protein n=1 Tax=Miniphocaeibacter halophilus TaxID=2931922 RepID=A0AC61MS59_9FIRM|nr:hemerythrin domain-containing protein [Miniphocaeibacter halophilus]QQK08267.1 hemerythrin domain-containing protein [Miniphocaeibacter halophilus]
MFTVDYLKKEHEELSVFVTRLEDECISILNGEEVNDEFFRAAIEFIRKYADETHHKKEEDILFKYMMDNLGAPAEKLIRTGMLTEHQMARYYVLELEKYLNNYKLEKNDRDKIQIIGNTMTYVNLLRSHIDKENNAVYPFGENNLSGEIKMKIDEEMGQRIEREEMDLDRKSQLLEIIYR